MASKTRKIQKTPENNLEKEQPTLEIKARLTPRTKLETGSQLMDAIQEQRADAKDAEGNLILERTHKLSKTQRMNPKINLENMPEKGIIYEDF